MYVLHHPLRICDEWKVVKLRIAHDHYKFFGFQDENFVEGLLDCGTTLTRQRELPTPMLRKISEREMLLGYSETWPVAKVTSTEDFLLVNQIVFSLTTVSKLKRETLDTMHGSMAESH